MKYNTISTSSLSSEGRKSTLTLYTDPDFLTDNKVSSSESEISSVRSELEIVQRALSLQTRRCRQLVAEYTRRLQEKEQQYQSEKLLRDDQLAMVLRALLIFEARLKQEQKYISHQLGDKDRIIKKQREHIHNLSSQYCKHCNQYYKIAESFGSSSEYVATTDYHDSNLESLDSSSETYATISEKDYMQNQVPKQLVELDDTSKEVVVVAENAIKLFQKNKSNKEGGGKRCKRIGHRKSIGDYYEVLKMRNDTMSPSSDNTSNDYEQLESLTAESSVSDKISLVSDRIENIFSHNPIQSHKAHLTEDNLDRHDQLINSSAKLNGSSDLSSSEGLDETLIKNESVGTDEKNDVDLLHSKINESIPQVFDMNEDDTINDNWYASASDPEDDDRRDWNRNGNNPNFLECMNQILLQNINDNINSPPKTPTMDRKVSSKRVKFSDEEDRKECKEVKNLLNAENIHNKMADYYETPIQKTPNFYETPQSIYSNDYEQILSKSSEKSMPITLVKSPEQESHYYVDMDTKSEENGQIVRKSKILRTPPALPPKPANLLSKYKIPKSPTKISTTPSIDSEPDYCSISELNLPPIVPPTAKKLNVVAEINLPSSDTKLSDKHVIIHSPKTNNDPIANAGSHYDLDKNDLIVVASKAVEKVNIQVAKQTAIKSDTSNASPSKIKLKVETEIPKLPQVSEIIIPDDETSNDVEPNETTKISHDNYIKLNSQIFKPKAITADARRPILIGSSVSSLITTFNNQQLMAEMQSNKSPPRGKLNKKLFSSFENLQNIERHIASTKSPPDETPSFEFDLSQNFEEFKLDDCDIDQYISDDDNDEKEERSHEEHILPDVITTPTPSTILNESAVEIIRVTNQNNDPDYVSIPILNESTIEVLHQQIEKEKVHQQQNSDETKKRNSGEPSYEHFLECTGLSSKSILTPARLLSNHKSILKPKDVKYRSKTKANVFERQGSTIKYWSEPYI